MNKKRYIVMLIVIVITCFAGCKSSEPVQKVDETTGEIFGFDSKLAVKTGDDGWIYFFTCTNTKGDDNPATYTFNGYNLKYKRMDNCIVEILDEDNNVISTEYANLPYLSANDIYAKDFENIRDFFYGSEPTTTLSEEQVDELDISILDKDLVVQLYNEAIESDKMAEGKYYYLPEADLVQEMVRNGYCWQVGFFIVQGTIVNVNIELIYSGDIYLSDLVAEDKADDNQKVIADAILEIEKKIMDRQSFEVGDMPYTSSDVDYKRLDNILKDIEKGSYK